MSKFLNVTYSVVVSADIEAIESFFKISWNDVEDYYVKWNILHITMQNGSHFEYELPYVEMCDLKYPDEVEIS